MKKLTRIQLERDTFFSGSAAEGACPLNPPTPKPVVGRGVWVNKLLVVKKGFNKYYYKYYSRPGGAGGPEVQRAHLGPWGFPECAPWDSGGFPEGYFGEGAGRARGGGGGGGNAGPSK